MTLMLFREDTGVSVDVFVGGVGGAGAVAQVVGVAALVVAVAGTSDD